MVMGMVCCIRFFDQFFFDVIYSGIGQFVILVFGLDVWVYCFVWLVGSIVYEVDMLEVIEFKIVMLSDLGVELVIECWIVVVDLCDDWVIVFQMVGFDLKVLVVWSVEGLLVYLLVEVQDVLFDNIIVLSVFGSWLVFEFVLDIVIFVDE